MPLAVVGIAASCATPLVRASAALESVARPAATSAPCVTAGSRNAALVIFASQVMPRYGKPLFLLTLGASRSGDVAALRALISAPRFVRLFTPAP